MYKVTIKTKLTQIEKNIQELTELEELLLKYKDYIQVKVDNEEHYKTLNKCS